MPIKATGDGYEKQFTFTCERCRAKTVRKVFIRRYDLFTGRTYTLSRNKKRPYAYWSQMLRSPQRRGVKLFYLYGSEMGFPHTTEVYCADHIQDKLDSAKNKSEKFVENYMEQRIDIFK